MAAVASVTGQRLSTHVGGVQQAVRCQRRSARKIMAGDTSSRVTTALHDFLRLGRMAGGALVDRPYAGTVSTVTDVAGEPLPRCMRGVQGPVRRGRLRAGEAMTGDATERIATVLCNFLHLCAVARGACGRQIRPRCMGGVTHVAGLGGGVCPMQDASRKSRVTLGA